MSNAAPITTRIENTHLGPVLLASDEVLAKPPAWTPLVLPAVREHPLSVLLRLGAVDDARDLGRFGLMASVTNPENEHNADLRRFERSWVRDYFETARCLRDIFPELEPRLSAYALAYIADHADPAKQSERGKVANHLRPADDPLAIELTRRSGRGWPWYGSSDSTPKTIAAEARALARDRQRAALPLIHPENGLEPGKPVLFDGQPINHGRAFVEALGWLLRNLESQHGAGLLWAGLNRADSFTYWRDSPNTFAYKGGQLAGPVVAPLGLQTEVLDALRLAAEVVDALPGESKSPDFSVSSASITAAADRLQASVLDGYLVTDNHGTYLADAVEPTGDGRLSKLDVPTIDLGKALNSTLLDDRPDLVDGIVEIVVSDEFLTPFGLTGRPRSDIRFNEKDYHVAVWAKAVHEFADGLRHHDYQWLAADLDARVMRHTADGLNPEYVGGSSEAKIDYCPRQVTTRRPTYDGRVTETVKERTPHTQQAWTVGAVIAIDALSRQIAANGMPPIKDFERQILAGIDPNDRAFRDHHDLAWDATGLRLAAFSGIDSAIAPPSTGHILGQTDLGQQL